MVTCCCDVVAFSYASFFIFFLAWCFAASLLGRWASHPSASLKAFWVLRTAVGLTGRQSRFLQIVFSLKKILKICKGTKNDIHRDTVVWIWFKGIYCYCWCFEFGWTILKGGWSWMKIQIAVGWWMSATKALNNMVGTSDQFLTNHAQPRDSKLEQVWKRNIGRSRHKLFVEGCVYNRKDTLN